MFHSYIPPNVEATTAEMVKFANTDLEKETNTEEEFNQSLDDSFTLPASAKPYND